jgi:adenosylmethionine-8-amino-7-oxononanoate transaminase
MNRWIRKDLKYGWHPYTQMKDCESFPPILIERAKGLKLYDSKGNFYYDTISSWWCNLHGHGHPAIRKAIEAQLDLLEHVLFAGFTHKSAIALAERLVSIVPKNLSRVFFSDDGSTAVETALKMSFQYWHNTGRKEKTGFISLDHGYHGDTVGAMSVSGLSRFSGIFSPLLFKSRKIPAPYCYRCPKGLTRKQCDIDCIEPLKSILRKSSQDVAALIIEPLVLAAGGMIVYPAEYLKKAADLAKKYNIHLIADEVATGFGRTGKMFACEHAGIEPDFMCLSKGLTAGYMPLGATLTSEKIYRAFYGDSADGKTFYHGHTYTANPVSCACALASLDIFRKERTLDRMKGLIPVFHGALEKFGDLPIVGDVRRIGLIGAFELVKDKRAKEPFGASDGIGLKIYREGLKRNLVLRPLGNITYLFLPLSVTEKELSYIVENTYRAIKSAASR